MIKICPRCQRALDEYSFNWKIKNAKRAVYCRDCSRQYAKRHYYKNRRYYLNKANKRNDRILVELQSFLLDYLRKHPCVDCGEKDILVLEFDHIDIREKSDDISKMLKNKVSRARLEEEISKCKVRCANCHRRRTAKQFGSWKLNMHP